MSIPTTDADGRAAAAVAAPLGAVCSDGITFGLSGAASDATVTAISDSCQEHWGLRPDEILGRPFSELFPRQAGWAPLAAELSRPRRVHDFVEVEWFLTITVVDDQVMAHLEPTIDTHQLDGTLWLAEATDDLQHAADLRDLWNLGCDHLRRRLGADRTMVLRVSEGKDAEILADAVGEGTESLAGMWVPGNFITGAVHRPHARIRSSSVRDTESAPSLVVPRADPHGRPWNVSRSPLRCDSTAHLDLLRGLGVRASISIPLTDDDGALDIVVVSHAFAPLTIDRVTRTEVELFAQLLHDRVVALERAAQTHRRAAQRRLRQELVGRIGGGSIADALVPNQVDGSPPAPNLLDLVHADAAIVNVQGEQRVIGLLDQHEADAVAEAVRAWLATLSQHGALQTDRAHEIHPRLAAAAPDVHGLLAISIGSQGDSLCWVRRPAEHTISRLDLPDANESVDFWPGQDAPQQGAPTPVMRVRQQVSVCEPWSDADGAAAQQLAREVEDRILRRMESELAQLALVDTLTGLPNRRLLLDRLDTAIARADRGHPFALLFIDLNDFKEINDRYGHQVGDDVLVEAAERMQQAVRGSDTVARLAGDEFVVLFDDVRMGDEDLVVQRIEQCFAAPFPVGGELLHLRAAIGVVTAELGLDAAALLDRADRAMYGVKERMRRDR